MFGITSFSEAPFSSSEIVNIAFSVTGVLAAVAEGTVLVSTGTRVDVTGVLAIASVGTVVATGTANVFPSGISITGYIGNPNVWSIITPNQTPNWQTVSTSQTPNWLAIAA